MGTSIPTLAARLGALLVACGLTCLPLGCADDGTETDTPTADADADGTNQDTTVTSQDTTITGDTTVQDVPTDTVAVDTTTAQDTTPQDTAPQDTTAQDTGAVGDTTPMDVPDPLAPEPIIYAHGPSVLYSLDPDTGTITELGSLQGCNNVIDMAVDKDTNIFVTTYSGLHRVDPDTRACTLVASGDYPNSLSFLPEGTFEPGVETLAGYFGSEYVLIDPVTGDVTSVGGLSGGYASSGDIVSVKGGGTFLTVTGPGCSDTDCLFEVDPVTGDLVTDWGPVGHHQVFGLAYWGGEAYGFSNGGDFFRLTFDDASSTVTAAPLTFPNAPPSLKFWGAGSTTIAPVIN